VTTKDPARLTVVRPAAFQHFLHEVTRYNLKPL
jgi:hypothetical protein